MDFQVRITEPALTDFEEIMAYAWATYPDSAGQFGRSLLNHLEILKTFPYVGGLVRERSGVRQLVHTPFLIYDAVFPEKRLVEVLHVWHASRRPPSL